MSKQAHIPALTQNIINPLFHFYWEEKEDRESF